VRVIGRRGWLGWRAAAATKGGVGCLLLDTFITLCCVLMARSLQF
jgi:hypothetical protein